MFNRLDPEISSVTDQLDQSMGIVQMEGSNLAKFIMIFNEGEQVDPIDLG